MAQDLNINDLYISRFIDSLEKDIDKWEKESYLICGDCWYEWYGPEYTNENNVRLKFVITSDSADAYIDGYMSWKVPFFNPFFKKHWMLIKAIRKMKKFTDVKCKEKYKSKLINSL